MDFLEWLLGCRHKRFSFPQTIKGVTHVVCLKCGKEFQYSWEEMRVTD